MKDIRSTSKIRRIDTKTVMSTPLVPATQTKQPPNHLPTCLTPSHLTINRLTYRKYPYWFATYFEVFEEQSWAGLGCLARSGRNACSRVLVLEDQAAPALKMKNFERWSAGARGLTSGNPVPLTSLRWCRYPGLVSGSRFCQFRNLFACYWGENGVY